MGRVLKSHSGEEREAVAVLLRMADTMRLAPVSASVLALLPCRRHWTRHMAVY